MTRGIDHVAAQLGTGKDVDYWKTDQIQERSEEDIAREGEMG